MSALLVAALALASTPATGAQTALITGIASRSGRVEGAQLVTITGTHVGGTTAVLFGGARTTRIQRVSDDQITVTTPAHGAGRVYVRVVTQNYGTSPQSEPATYIYVPRPPTLANAGSARTHSLLSNAEVDCASPTWCGAGGYNDVEGSGYGFPAAEVYTGSGWGPQRAVGSDGFSPSTVSVACAATPAKVCLFGTADGLVYRTTDGRTWTSTDLNVASVLGSPSEPYLTCATSQFCLAFAGGYTWTWNGTSWSAPQQVLGADGRPSGRINDISCPTTTFCMAVVDGAPARYLLWRSGTWGQVQTVPTTASGAQLASVTCSGATYCLVRGLLSATKEYVAWTGLAWSPPQPGEGFSSFTGSARPTFQCLSGTVCVRSEPGNDADTPSTFQTYNGDQHTQDALPPLSCWAAYQCLAVDVSSSYVTTRGAP